MKLRHLLFIFFILNLFNLSCTNYKNVPYFQHATPNGVFVEKITNFSSLTVQPGDLLAIHVTSLNHDADAIFNYNLEHSSERTKGAGTSNSTSITETSPGQNTVVGYLVDQQGNIHLPMVGLTKVAGSTISEITSDLESKLSEFLSSPNVEIRLQNFKISVLGDVKNPGYFNPQDEHITVTQALALAGDLNSTGIRKVLLIREVDGVRQYIPLDLTSINTISSPYYYLKNNDVIYVQPNRVQIEKDGTAFQKVTFALAVLTILIYIFKK